MKKRIEGDSSLMRARRMIEVDGFFLFAEELGRRAGITFRRWMLARELRCPDLVIGPRAHLGGLAHIRIGKNFKADEGLWLMAITGHSGQTFTPSIVIGNDVSISRWSHIAATHKIEIGDGVLIGSNVLITDHNHGQYREGTSGIDLPPAQRLLDNDRSVVIGKNVWLGDGVVVMPGVTVGEGSVIGANSVVTRDVAPFTVAAGAPAAALKRFDLTTLQWRKL